MDSYVLNISVTCGMYNMGFEWVFFLKYKHKIKKKNFESCLLECGIKAPVIKRTQQLPFYNLGSVECVSKLVHWTPKHGTKRRGRPALNYMDVITQDTRLDVSDVRTAMQNRKVWRAIVDRGHHPD